LDFVNVQTVIDLVKLAGSDAVHEGDVLKVYPKDGVPVVYQIPPTGLARRVIIQIGKRTGVKSHLFWHPDQALTPSSGRADLRVLEGGKPKKTK
jgi:hypothetical protein